MNRPKLSLGLSIGMILAVMLLVLSASIAVPIWFRPFFYWHIDWLNLTDTGWTRSEIIEAYNEMINYCTLFIPMRNVDGQWYYGVLKCSESGRSHFTDVRGLFTLDAVVLLVSLTYVVTVGILSKKNVIKLRRIAKRSTAFWGGLAAIAVPVLIGALAATDFDRAFEVFHSVFFPGKDNWIFDWYTDEIIRVMPQEFFRDCAILIGVCMVIASGLCMGLDFRKRKIKAVGTAEGGDPMPAAKQNESGSFGVEGNASAEAARISAYGDPMTAAAAAVTCGDARLIEACGSDDSSRAGESNLTPRPLDSALDACAPKISVLMGVYNDAAHVAAALDSVLSQTFTDFEVIAVDDCSVDGSGEVLARYAREDARVRVCRNDSNLGLAASLNRGLGLARGQYVARMDSDDLSHPTRFMRQVQFLESHPEFALVGTGRNFFDGGGIWGSSVSENAPTLENIYRGNSFAHPTVMMRAAVLREAGGYTVAKETLRAEDYDLWCKIYLNGGRGYNLGEILFDYREDTRNMKKRKYRYRIDLCRLMLAWRKKLGLPWYLALLAFKPLLVGLIPAKMLIAQRKRRYAKTR